MWLMRFVPDVHVTRMKIDKRIIRILRLLLAFNSRGQYDITLEWRACLPKRQENLRCYTCCLTRAVSISASNAGMKMACLHPGWGVAAVTSRAFRLRSGGGRAIMLPLIDMCSHTLEPNAKVWQKNCRNPRWSVATHAIGIFVVAMLPFTSVRFLT